MRKVLIPTRLDGIAREILAANGNYEVVQDASSGLPDLAGRHPGAYALIVRSEEVTPAVIDALPGLKVIVRAGSGYDTIDIKHARRKGIDVMNTPGANANAVAEEAVALMLADARWVVPADVSTRSGKWEKAKFMGRELAGKTVGIVGLGSVGRLVAQRLSGFDVKLLGCDPAIAAERARELGVQLTDLETLFAESDYVTLHIPETRATRGLVSGGLLARMKEGATLVNCARAGIVDEQALREAKKARRLRYLNDVYEKDEEGRKSVADVADLMLPHLGANTLEANRNAARRAAEELIEYTEKGITSFIVNRSVPEGLDEMYCTLANTLARLCRCLIGKAATPKLIETTFYGGLGPFAEWLLAPIVAGISEDFDPSMDYSAARACLANLGIDYANRATDPGKGYGNSMTVDLISDVGGDYLRRVSLRGTVAERVMMVSRINEFNKLFFEPAGCTLFCLYDDRPGVLGKIGARLAGAGINIEDVRCPHDPQTGRSLAVLKVNQLVPDRLLRELGAEINAISVSFIKL
jgi:D-3-phosphoglycerate dehydrogenase